MPCNINYVIDKHKPGHKPVDKTQTQTHGQFRPNSDRNSCTKPAYKRSHAESQRQKHAARKKPAPEITDTQKTDTKN